MRPTPCSPNRLAAREKERERESTGQPSRRFHARISDTRSQRCHRISFAGSVGPVFLFLLFCVANEKWAQTNLHCRASVCVCVRSCLYAEGKTRVRVSGMLVCRSFRACYCRARDDAMHACDGRQTTRQQLINTARVCFLSLSLLFYRGRASSSLGFLCRIARQLYLAFNNGGSTSTTTVASSSYFYVFEFISYRAIAQSSHQKISCGFEIETSEKYKFKETEFIFHSPSIRLDYYW